MIMKKINSIALALTFVTSIFTIYPPALAQTVRPKIQIAILLDSSNSMDGLIDQTRYQLWEIVNSLTKVTKDGVVPELEVALYHYGNDSLPASEGYLTQLNGFTSELDLVSENLFGIKTYGGLEYAGWVIETAMNQLEWSDSDQDFKAIFIAGNEPFNQGGVDWQEAVNLAKQNNVLVNTIYCGGEESQERSLWAMGAQIGLGSHLTINQNQAIAFIPSPYDEEITALNQQLNSTYIPYGAAGIVGLSRQAVEDSNSGAQIVTRGVSKVSEFYNNASWDLIDAIAQESVSLETLEAEDLPEVMQNMNEDERLEYINTQQTERMEIQERMRELSNLRTTYLQEQRETNRENDTLDYVMITTLENQLEKKGFSFQKEL
jgi:hypothetical protein